MSSPDHGSRAHSEWPPSSCERHWNCAGSLALEDENKQGDRESQAAAWGTACHEVSEMCLTQGQPAEVFIGRIVKTKSNSIEVDAEMAETAQTYVDYINARLEAYAEETGHDAKLSVEEKVSLDSLSPPLQSWGTADAKIWFPDWSLLEIVDLKGGRGIAVKAEGNKQLSMYALGAVLSDPSIRPDTVMKTIVQPRVFAAPSHETIDIMDLMDWSSDLLDRMRAAIEARTEYLKVRDVGILSQTKWAEKYTKVGPWCTFCRGELLCPLKRRFVEEQTGLTVDDFGQPHAGNNPLAMSEDDLARALAAIDVIEGWIKAVRAAAHDMAKQGHPIPGWKLVKEIGRETFKDPAAIAMVLDIMDVPAAVYQNEPKVRTPKQIRSALKKLPASVIDDDTRNVLMEEINKASETPVRGTCLVREDVKDRAHVKSDAEKFFG